jgi:hypothetical protein
MTASTYLLKDLFGRVAEDLPVHLDGLDLEALHWQPDPKANPVGWLAWHIGRIEDAQMAHIARTEQVWHTGGWVERFRLPYGHEDVGYGQSAAQVSAFQVADPALLSGYYAAVHTRTDEILDQLAEGDFDRIIDRHWDPPVTLGVRIVSTVNDITQHVGQISYVRGLWERRRRADR